MIKPDMVVFHDMLNGIDKLYSIDTGGQVSQSVSRHAKSAPNIHTFYVNLKSQCQLKKSNIHKKITLFMFTLLDGVTRLADLTLTY